MLNSDGEIDGEGETHAERHARIVAATTQVGSSAIYVDRCLCFLQR